MVRHDNKFIYFDICVKIAHFHQALFHDRSQPGILDLRTAGDGGPYNNYRTVFLFAWCRWLQNSTPVNCSHSSLNGSFFSWDTSWSPPSIKKRLCLPKRDKGALTSAVPLSFPGRAGALVSSVTGRPAGAYCFRPRRSEVILPLPCPAASHHTAALLGGSKRVLVLFHAFELP